MTIPRSVTETMANDKSLLLDPLGGPHETYVMYY